jgi:hypothetical protein
MITKGDEICQKQAPVEGSLVRHAEGTQEWNLRNNKQKADS